MRTGSAVLARWLSGLIERLADRMSDEPSDQRALRKAGGERLSLARHGMVPDPVREAGIALDLLEEHYRQWELDHPSDDTPTLITRAGHQRWIMAAALLAGKLDQAAELANSVIGLEQELQRRRPDFGDGSAIHFACITLGHVALQRGDLEYASRCLLAAAEVPGGDPALWTYGPDLELAQALLDQGVREPVIRYLRSWRSRWGIGRELLDWWITQLAAGRAARVNKAKYLKTRRLTDFIPGLRSILR